MKKSNVGLGRLKRKRVDARAVLAYPVNPASIKLDYAFVAAANVEDEGEPAILLFQTQHLVCVYAFAGSGGADDELYSDAIDISILKIRCACPGLENIQVLGVEVVRMRMTEM